MGEFVRAGKTCLLVIHDGVARELVIRSGAIPWCSMLSDDEVLTLSRSATLAILQLGGVCGLGDHVQLISNELQNAAKSGKSKSQRAFEICRKALELYLREWNRETLLHREFETSVCEIIWDTDSV
jgi:hypothetical protein